MKRKKLFAKLKKALRAEKAKGKAYFARESQRMSKRMLKAYWKGPSIGARGGEIYMSDD